MSDAREIRQAYIDHVARNLENVSNRLGNVEYGVQITKQEVEQVHNGLEMLVQEFREFVSQTEKENALQRALTRIIEVRQELEKKFGHHDEIRRYTTGILQANDLSIVRNDTINKCTEELMISAPKYWLAPCLVALAAWIDDNEELANKALSEALKRDDEKTSLLFALICRRANKYEASLIWIERYLAMQDPSDMEHNVLVIIDAFSNGVFGADSKGVCAKRIMEWIEELSDCGSFTQVQKERWMSILDCKRQGLYQDEYQLLANHAVEWNDFKACMEMARAHKLIHDEFMNIFAADTNVYIIIEKIDEILNSLVTNYDNQELSLKREERKQELIIDEKGDERAALNRFQYEEDEFVERVDFVKQLTNVAIAPDNFGVSNATQKLAIALSKDWISEAYEDLTTQYRMGIPSQFALKIADWEGVTKDGSEENELVNSIRAYVSDLKEKALSQIKFSTVGGIATIFGGLIFIGSLVGGNLIFAIAGLLALLWAYKEWKNVDVRKEEAIQKIDDHERELVDTLRACLAEVVDFKREYAKRDAEFEETLAFMSGLSSSQFVMSDKKVRDIFMQ